MAGIDLPKQTTVYKSGQPLTALHLITSGVVKVQYPGGEYQLGKGDVIGITELASEVHFLSYTTLTDINMLTYTYTSTDTLLDLLQKHPDVARLFLLSAFRQITSLLNQCDVSAIEANNLFTGLVRHNQLYLEICNRYRMNAQILPSFDILDNSFLEESLDIWLSNYYKGLLHIFSQEGTRLPMDSAVVYGFLRKNSQDFQKTYQSVEERYLHKKQLLYFYMNDSSQDLFAYLTALYHKVTPESPESKEIYEILEYIMELFQDTPSDLLRQRITGFKSSIFNMNSVYTSSQEQIDIAFTYAQLHGSLPSIMAYADMDEEARAACQKTVNAYKAIPDRTSTSDDAELLRKELTKHFYSLYSIVAVKSLKEGNAPLPVQLFLYFGYMDEELAGAENCQVLTKLLQQRTEGEQTGVYAFYDWLKAIYEGKKEPSRNEYDEDYSDYVHKQKLSGTISDADVKALENNTISKVVFELRNMFPIANKMTYGRLATFCPVFTAENALKPLNTSYVTASSVGHALTRIQSVDFSLFYRETNNPDTKSPFKEQIHVKCLPDIILMPNMGIRSVMWQEIEGKRRSTPSRMIFSIFHMEDVYTSMIRLAGEYRWEMCKRIQGYRWNDISTPSLTSEYFDYIQFYRKNRALSAEAKERVKNNLQRARNSFKEMFVRDYILWILFESAGSPRLNKVSREILFRHCPFPDSVRTSLKQNPQYGELLQRFDLKRQQKLHHLNQFRKKLLMSNTPVPAEVDAEIEYYST